MRPYRDITRFTATLGDIAVQFSTEDEYSKSWFFPRYSRGRIHEKPVTEMLVESLRSATCFVDVGTNLGWYTCLAARHMPSGRVFGFEMDDLSFALLEKNIRINGLTNVEVHNAAISDLPGVAHYRRTTGDPDSARRLQNGTGSKNAAGLVSVESMVLDDFLEIRGIVPDVVKIDVEGAEMNVLKGMRQVLRRHKPTIFLEIHPGGLHYFGTSTPAILALLIESGYEVGEVKNIRRQGAETEIEPLSRDSILRDNTMLHAVAPGSAGPGRAKNVPLQDVVAQDIQSR